MSVNWGGSNRSLSVASWLKRCVAGRQNPSELRGWSREDNAHSACAKHGDKTWDLGFFGALKHIHSSSTCFRGMRSTQVGQTTGTKPVGAGADPGQRGDRSPAEQMELGQRSRWSASRLGRRRLRGCHDDQASSNSRLIYLRVFFGGVESQACSWATGGQGLRAGGSPSAFQMCLCTSAVTGAMQNEGTMGTRGAAGSWELLHEVLNRTSITCRAGRDPSVYQPVSPAVTSQPPPPSPELLL